MQAKQIAKAFYIVLLSFSKPGSAQMSFYQDLFAGGVTCAGYSPTYSQTTPITGVITVNIPSGSTIRTAYLFAGRLGPTPATNVTLNGNTLTFDTPNQVTPSFNTIYGGASAVHAINVTSIVTTGVNVYNLGLPSQANTSNRYQDYYLYIAYNNSSMPMVGTAIFLNAQNAASTMNFGTLTLNNAINTAGDAAYSFFGGYECSVTDGENIILNGTNLGVVVGGDINSGLCGGPVGSFWYANDVVTALSDDNISQGMSGPEALSKFNALTTNGSTTVSLSFVHNNAGATDNHPWGSFFAYKSGAILPIELSSFEVVCQNNKALLDWTTAMELNNDHFTVERSADAVNYTPIAIIPGGGNSKQKRYYTYTDADPGNGTRYYRLRQSDKNETSTVSNPAILQSCTLLSEFKPEVFPNPATDKLNINFGSLPDQVSYQVINNIGEMVGQGQLENRENSIRVNQFPKGIYTIVISGQESVFTYRFVKD